MHAAMSRGRKVALAILLVSVVLFGVAVWSESRATVVLSGASLERGRRLAEKGDSRVTKEFENEVAMVNSSFTTITFYAVGIVFLSFASFVAVWLPRREKGTEEPNQLTVPSPEMVTPGTGAPAAPTPPVVHR
jgi:hypothetical protein